MIRSAFALFFISILVSTPVARADFIRVRHIFSFEERILELRKGERADITVNLHGAGQPVGRFRIFVVPAGQRRYLATGLSDDNGMLTFPNIPPGDYILELRQREGEEDSYIEIGDVVLSVSKGGQGSGSQQKLE